MSFKKEIRINGKLHFVRYYDGSKPSGEDQIIGPAMWNGKYFFNVGGDVMEARPDDVMTVSFKPG